MLLWYLRFVGDTIIWEVDCDGTFTGDGGDNNGDGIIGSVEYILVVGEAEEIPAAFETPLAVRFIIEPTPPRFQRKWTAQARIVLDVDKLLEDKIEVMIIWLQVFAMKFLDMQQVRLHLKRLCVVCLTSRVLFEIVLVESFSIRCVLADIGIRFVL